MTKYMVIEDETGIIVGFNFLTSALAYAGIREASGISVTVEVLI